MKLSLGLKIVLMKLVRVELDNQRNTLAYLNRCTPRARADPELWNLKQLTRDKKGSKKIIAALQKSLREDFK